MASSSKRYEHAFPDNKHPAAMRDPVHVEAVLWILYRRMPICIESCVLKEQFPFLKQLWACADVNSFGWRAGVSCPIVSFPSSWSVWPQLLRKGFACLATAVGWLLTELLSAPAIAQIEKPLGVLNWNQGKHASFFPQNRCLIYMQM